MRNKEAEFVSLIQKSPKFGTLITTGQVLFNKMCAELVEENKKLVQSGEKQLLIGIQESAERNAYVERMFSLLVEAGLLFGFSTPVSHGKARTYERFIPHLGALIRDRAFSDSSRGFSPSKIVEGILLPSAKH